MSTNDDVGGALCPVRGACKLVVASWATPTGEYKPVETSQQTLDEEPASIVFKTYLSKANSKLLEAEHEMITLLGKRSENNERSERTNTLRAAEVRVFSIEDYLERMDSSFKRTIFQTLMAACRRGDQHTTTHHEDISTLDLERTKARSFPSLSGAFGRSKCPDPERGTGQHYSHPRDHKDKDHFEEQQQQTSPNAPNTILELILWCSSAASCWTMERLARPDVNPPATVFVSAIWAYAVSTGMIYFIYSESRSIDLGILCSGLFGMLVGWTTTWTVEEVLFRLLPGFLLSGIFIATFKDAAFRKFFS